LENETFDLSQVSEGSKNTIHINILDRKEPKPVDLVTYTAREDRTLTQREAEELAKKFNNDGSIP
jgi:hypothetical protein